MPLFATKVATTLDIIEAFWLRQKAETEGNTIKQFQPPSFPKIQKCSVSDN